jgi:hypothetical protein
MRNLKGVVVAAATVAVAILAVCPASAATCPAPTINGTGYFVVTTSPGSSCIAYGDGNFGQASGDAFLASAAGAGYVLLDDTDSTDEGVFASTSPLGGGFVNGAASGSFSIGATPGYDMLVLGLKDGNLGPIPGGSLKWAAFLLGALTGDWQMFNSDGTLRYALSHAVLYGKSCGGSCFPPDPIGGPNSVVPVPPALPLFASGLIAMGLLSRRRRKRMMKTPPQ